MSTLASVFVGVPQSRYAAIAIILAMLVVSGTILFGKDPIPLSQKFGFVLLVFLVTLPSLLMSLFQLTCLVTGAGFKNQRWWCSMYAWIVSALMIVYAVMLVAAAVMTMTAKDVPPSKPQMQSPHTQSRPPVDLTHANKMVEQFFYEEKEEEKGKPVPQVPAIEMEVPAPKLPKLDDTFVVNGDRSIPAPFMGAEGSMSGAPLLEGFYSADTTNPNPKKPQHHE